MKTKRDFGILLQFLQKSLQMKETVSPVFPQCRATHIWLMVIKKLLLHADNFTQKLYEIFCFLYFLLKMGYLKNVTVIRVDKQYTPTARRFLTTYDLLRRPWII